MPSIMSPSSPVSLLAGDVMSLCLARWWCAGALVVRWWCAGGALVVRWWCAGALVVLCGDDDAGGDNGDSGGMTR